MERATLCTTTFDIRNYYMKSGGKRALLTCECDQVDVAASSVGVIPGASNIRRSGRRACPRSSRCSFDNFQPRPPSTQHKLRTTKEKKGEWHTTTIHLSSFTVSPLFQYFINSFTAFSTSSDCGRMKSSTCGAYATNVSVAPTRRTGASRYSNNSFEMRAAISAP